MESRAWSDRGNGQRKILFRRERTFLAPHELGEGSLGLPPKRSGSAVVRRKGGQLGRGGSKLIFAEGKLSRKKLVILSPLEVRIGRIVAFGFVQSFVSTGKLAILKREQGEIFIALASK